jgi:hypothetical protein
VRLAGIQPLTGDHLEWQLISPPEEGERVASIFFNLRPRDDKNPLQALHHTIQFNEVTWLSPIRGSDEWALDLDELGRWFPEDFFPVGLPTGLLRVRYHQAVTSMAGTPRWGIEFSASHRPSGSVWATILPHAAKRMAERGITPGEVFRALAEPDEEGEANMGRRYAQRTIGPRLIRVVYNPGAGDERIVVTVMLRRR